MTAPKPNLVVPNFAGPCKLNEPNPLLPVLLPPLNAEVVGIEDCPNAGVAVCLNTGFPKALVLPNADIIALEPKDGCPKVTWDVCCLAECGGSALAENSDQTRWAV